MDAMKVVECARGYIDTAFIHQGRLKGVGVDCAGLVVCIAKELSLSNFDYFGYSRYPAGENLRSICDSAMTKIMAAEAKPGDVVLFSIMGQPQHLAIIGNYHAGGLSIIHAYYSVGKVVESFYGSNWGSRAVQYYRLPGVE